MALTRRQLTALGIEPEKIEEIITSHSETVSALKEDIEKYKAEAEKLQGVQAELEGLKKSIEGKDYDALQKEFEEYKTAKQKEFDDYKAEIAKKEAHAAKEQAYREMLKDANLSEKGVEKALKYADWDSIELDDDGHVKDAKGVVKTVREEWAEYILKSETKGAETANPPAGKGNETMTKEKIMAIKDRNERQKAISENHELFGY